MAKQEPETEEIPIPEELTDDELNRTAGASWHWRGWEWSDSGGYSDGYHNQSYYPSDYGYNYNYYYESGR
jgi:hypothetical protein